MLSWRSITRFHRRLQYSPCMGSAAKVAPPWSGALAARVRTANWLCWGPPWAVQLHFHCVSGMTLGTPKRRRSIWRNRSSGTCAAAVGIAWMTTPEFAHDEERTWAARSLLY